MRISRSLAASALCLATSCATSLESFTTSDEAAVYVAVIESAFMRKDGGRLYISNESLVDPDMSGGHELWPALEAAQATGLSVPSVLPLHCPYRVLSDTEVDAAFDEPRGWDGFYRTYPDAQGLIQCSAIGFDESHRRALVVVGTGSSGLRGWGATFYLEKGEEGWHVVKRVSKYIV